MKNVFVSLLCVLLTACFIWGCTLSGEASGLAKEKNELTRKYRVLQTLYAQVKEDAEQAEKTHAAEKAAFLAQEKQWEARLQAARSAFSLPSESAAPGQAASAPAPEVTPAEAPDDQAAAEEGRNVFNVPMPSPAPQPEDTETQEAAKEDADKTAPLSPEPDDQPAADPIDDAEAEPADEAEADEGEADEAPSPDEESAPADDADGPAALLLLPPLE